MRVLIGYADTEGTPHVKTNDSELWNAAIVFKYVVCKNEKPKEIFNVAHLSLNKKAKKKDVKASLKTHFSAIEFIKQMYECDEVRVGFWNAGHDMSVLNSYGDTIPFVAVDMLKLAREKNKGLKSYNIGNLCEHFGVDIAKEHKVHTGLGDVLRMFELFPYLGINDPNLLVIRNEQQHKSKPKTQTKKNEAEVGTIRRHGSKHPNQSKSFGPQVKIGLQLQRSKTDTEIARTAIQLARKLKL